jgi:hypothetical protein
MAETTVLAAGTTAAAGATSITVAAGATVMCCMFPASGNAMSDAARIDLIVDGTAGNAKFTTLTGGVPCVNFRNDTTMSVTLTAYRPAQSDSVGLFTLA